MLLLRLHTKLVNTHHNLKDEKLSLQIGQEKPEQLERSNQQIKNAKKNFMDPHF